MVHASQQQVIVCLRQIGVANGAEHPRPYIALVGPQMQDGVVQLPRQRQRPELIPLAADALGVNGRRILRATNLEESRTQLPVNLHDDVFVDNLILAELSRQRTQYDALTCRQTDALCGQFLRPFCHRVIEPRARRKFVHQPPLQRPGASHSLRRRAQEVGVVAAHPALIHQPGQAAGAGQHRQQRQLRQRHRAGPIVNQYDVVTGQSQFIPAARSRAVDGADVPLP